MADGVSDEVFARALKQLGGASLEQLEAAKRAQEESAKKGVPLPLADVLIQLGVITPAIRENVEKKCQAQQTGGLKRLGPYELLKKLGEGGMGAVYLAEDTSVGRKVAVKVLAKKYSEEREFLARFRREAQASGKLSHVNIVLAYNVGEEAGAHYYAMEYCDGDTLDRILKREQCLPWDKALAVTIQVARGLKHAHDHGIIHRDIKPANIFICSPARSAGVPPVPPQDTGGTPVLQEGFIAKILDLGLSKNIASTEQSFLTQTGAALGTPHYISPEQARGDKDIDGRTDIYSLGATLYHLVTGQTPFTGTTAGVVMMKHLSEQLPNPQDLNADIPDGVVQIIQKMMAKAPADRYANCAELLADLELASQGKQPSSVNLDPALTTIATRRKGAQAKGAAKPRAARPGAALVRKKAEPVPLEPVEEATRVEAEPRPLGSGPLAYARSSETAGGDTRLRRKRYIAAGVAALVLLVVVAALGLNKPETRNPKHEGTSKPETTAAEPQAEAPPATLETANLKPEIAGAVDDPALWKNAINLLPLVDTKRDGIYGVWSIKNGELVLDDGEGFTARLQLSYQPPEEYDFRVEFTLGPDSAEVCQLLNAAGHSFTWIMGLGGGPMFGFHLVNGEGAEQDPSPALMELKPLTPGRRYSSLMQVRKQGVAAYFDGKLAVNWKTDYRDMGLDYEWRLPEERRLGVGCFAPEANARGGMTFHSIEVREVTSKVKIIKPTPFVPDEAFDKEVAALPAEQQVQRVIAKLKELDPGFDGQEKHKVQGCLVDELILDKTGTLTDISAIHALRTLRNFRVSNTKVRDISALRGLPLKKFDCQYSNVNDLSPLSGMPLEYLSVFHSLVRDLSPLKGAPLGTLRCDHTCVTDLSPLRGMPLHEFGCHHVTDLSPLRGMPLTALAVCFSNVSDLSPLVGMPLRDLNITNSKVSDLSPIVGMPLTGLNLTRLWHVQSASA